MNGITLSLLGNSVWIYVRLHVLHGAIYLLGIKGYFGHLS